MFFFYYFRIREWFDIFSDEKEFYCSDTIEIADLSFSDLKISVDVSKAKKDLNFTGSFQSNIMDFYDLCWIDLIPPANFKVSLQKVYN